MAPNLADSQHVIIQGMIEEGSLTNDEMATVVNCSSRSISTARTNYRRFGSTKAPYNGRGGRPRSLTDPEVDTLLDLLRENPWLHRDEIAIFLGDRFDELRSTSTIGRALKKAGWSKKVARRIAKEQCADLRDMYLHDLSPFEVDRQSALTR
jgi:transposase